MAIKTNTAQISNLTPNYSIKIPFVKMHGLGNNFIMLDGADLSLISNEQHNKLIAHASNAATGIGCDQVIIYQMQKAGKVSMAIYNNDSSKAKACGNGARCLGRLIHDLTHISQFDIIAGDRELPVKYNSDGSVQVNMGIANFDCKWIPKESEIWQLAQQFGLEPKEVICVDMGNPHFVIFSQVQEAEKETIGRKLQTHSLFPDGINVNFASNRGNQLDITVYERGAGFTLACGSGACASFAAARKIGLCENNLQINFPLGSLKMSQLADSIIMEGPAEYAFKGELYL